MTQTISWTAGNGSKVDVIIRACGRLVKEAGEYVEIGTKKVTITAEIDGVFTGMYIESMTGHAQFVARIGRAGLTAERLAEINTTIKNIESTIQHNTTDDFTDSESLVELANGNMQTA